MRTIKKGATDQTLYFDVLDSGSTTGGRKTGLAFNTASLTAYYVRNQGSPTAITLVTLAAANSAHADGGFKEVDAANMPGVYRLDLPDAAVATGADGVVVTIRGAVDMVQVSTEIMLVDNVAADVMARLGAPAGASVSADVAAVKTAVDDVPTSAELATALAGADDAILAQVALVKAKTDALPSDPADASDISAAFGTVNTSLGTIAGYLDTEIGAIKTVTDGLGSALSSLATASSLATVDSVVDAIKLVTDRLGDTLEDDDGTYRFTADALAEAPTGGGGGGGPTAVEIRQEIDANSTQLAAIKAKTDGLSFTVSGAVDANLTHVNETAVTGTGATGDEWGPA